VVDDLLDDVEGTIAAAAQTWWKSKKLIVVISHHVLSTIGSWTAMLLDHSTIPSIGPVWLSSITAVTLGHNVIQGRADNTIAANPVPAPQPPPTPVQSAPGPTPTPPVQAPVPPPHPLP
jgi:hypothetical protein